MKAIMDAFEAMPYLTIREANNIQQYQDDDDWDFWDLKSIVMDESLEDDSWMD